VARRGLTVVRRWPNRGVGLTVVRRGLTVVRIGPKCGEELT
jgi:hypothetical protein